MRSFQVSTFEQYPSGWGRHVESRDRPPARTQPLLSEIETAAGRSFHEQQNSAGTDDGRQRRRPPPPPSPPPPPGAAPLLRSNPSLNKSKNGADGGKGREESSVNTKLPLSPSPSPSPSSNFFFFFPPPRTSAGQKRFLSCLNRFPAPSDGRIQRRVSSLRSLSR